MPTSHANEAAALAAGYKVDKGTKDGVFYTRWYKDLRNDVWGDPMPLEVVETSTVSQAAADTAALATLNANRNTRYGYAAAGGNKGNSGNAHTVDVN